MTSLWPILAACFANGMCNYCWNVYSAWMSEVFPTEVRSSGMGFLQCLGILSSLVFTYGAGMIYDIDFRIPILAAIALTVLGVVSVLPLPETKGASLKDQLQKLSAKDLENLNPTIKNRTSEKVPLLQEDQLFREDTAHGDNFLALQN
eukprot:TRINITY_DN60302_c0_g1_i1.p1 TRINITY_DN60302_c0_g1~~TRINITY_DN60302_c0_g1_i1.p1  ORF type:complete len:148 (+),score=19.41 TRINITY_DN60302_c0_g1_i1:78-521(+)